MPRGGPRPGAGRPPEGIRTETVRISLPPEGWAKVEAFLARVPGPQSRALGHLLLLGVEKGEEARLPWWRRLLRCLRGRA